MLTTAVELLAAYVLQSQGHDLEGCMEWVNRVSSEPLFRFELLYLLHGRVYTLLAPARHPFCCRCLG